MRRELGKSDLLLRSAGNVAVWELDGTHVTAQAQFGASSAWDLRSGNADYNADGKSDILLENAAGDVVQWLMDGTNIAQSGSFQLHSGDVLI